MKTCPPFLECDAFNIRRPWCIYLELLEWTQIFVAATLHVQVQQRKDVLSAEFTMRINVDLLQTLVHKFAICIKLLDKSTHRNQICYML
jgi:hypothetical protein